MSGSLISTARRRRDQKGIPSEGEAAWAKKETNLGPQWLNLRGEPGTARETGACIANINDRSSRASRHLKPDLCKINNQPKG
jgi:hypothetical protein